MQAFVHKGTRQIYAYVQYETRLTGLVYNNVNKIEFWWTMIPVLLLQAYLFI